MPMEDNEPEDLVRARAEITSHFAAGPQARWRGASDELYPGRYVRSEQQSQRACGPQPEGARGAPATPAGAHIVIPLLSGGLLRSPPANLPSPRWGAIRTTEVVPSRLFIGVPHAPEVRHCA